jgi:hypothetical protein
MLNEILGEFEKVRDKDKSTKKSIRDLIKGLKSELVILESELESVDNQMMVRRNIITYSSHSLGQ